MSLTNRELSLIQRMRRVGALRDRQTASIWLHDRATHDERRGLMGKLFPVSVCAEAA